MALCWRRSIRSLQKSNGIPCNPNSFRLTRSHRRRCKWRSATCLQTLPNRRASQRIRLDAESPAPSATGQTKGFHATGPSQTDRQLPNKASEQSRRDVVMSSFSVAPSWIVRAIARRIHVVQKLPITVTATRTAGIASVVHRTRRAEIGSVKALMNQRVSAPRVARPTRSPRRALRLNRRAKDQIRD